MLSWPILSLIITADLALISGALAHLFNLPGYDRYMYMEGIGIREQRRIRMEVFGKVMVMTAIIFGAGAVLFLILGICVPDSDTLKVVNLPEDTKIIEMEDGASFVITTKKCVWVRGSDAVDEIAVNLRAIARGVKSHREPQLKVKSVDTLLGTPSLSNRLVLVLKNPDEMIDIIDPILDLQAE